MICFRCKKEILVKSNYYSFTEFDKGQVINTNYAHRVCWDEFLKNIGNVDEAMGVLRGLKKGLIKQGILPEEEMIIG